MVLRLLALLVVLTGCKEPTDEYPESGVVIKEWVSTAVPECGFKVELPNGAERNDSLLVGGSRSIIYISEVSPVKYFVACVHLAETIPTPTPAQALQGQTENLISVLTSSGLAIRDQTLTNDKEGGTYELEFSTGLHIVGRVRLVGRQIHDLSGSFEPKSKRSRAQLDRVLGSYQRL